MYVRTYVGVILTSVVGICCKELNTAKGIWGEGLNAVECNWCDELEIGKGICWEGLKDDEGICSEELNPAVVCVLKLPVTK